MAAPGRPPDCPLWKTWADAEPELRRRFDLNVVAALRRAYAFAAEWHGDQRRPAGEPYTEHLIEVLDVLVRRAAVTDPDVLESGLLHDVVEDTPCTIDDVTERFGSRVADLVGWLTKPVPAAGDDAGSVRTAYLERITGAPMDVRVVKLADRYSNVHKLDTHPRPEKRRSYFAETSRHFLPLAAGVPPFDRLFTDWRERHAHLGRDVEV